MNGSVNTWSYTATNGEVFYVTRTPNGFLVETKTAVIALLPHGAAAALSDWIADHINGRGDWTGRVEQEEQKEL